MRWTIERYVRFGVPFREHVQMDAGTIPSKHELMLSSATASGAGVLIDVGLHRARESDRRHARAQRRPSPTPPTFRFRLARKLRRAGEVAPAAHSPSQTHPDAVRRRPGPSCLVRRPWHAGPSTETSGNPSEVKR